MAVRQKLWKKRWADSEGKRVEHETKNVRFAFLVLGTCWRQVVKVTRYRVKGKKETVIGKTRRELLV